MPRHQHGPGREDVKGFTFETDFCRDGNPALRVDTVDGAWRPMRMPDKLANRTRYQGMPRI